MRLEFLLRAYPVFPKRDKNYAGQKRTKKDKNTSTF